MLVSDSLTTSSSQVLALALGNEKFPIEKQYWMQEACASVVAASVVD